MEHIYLVYIYLYKKDEFKVLDRLFFVSGFLGDLRKRYKNVKECRLKSTRKESTEIYVLAKLYQQ